MKRFVLDASVAVKWFLPAEREQYLPEAENLFSLYERSAVQFLVPDVFWLEVANVFWKTVRRGFWTATEARAALEEMYNLQFDSIQSRHLLSLAYTIATDFGRTLYDSVYIAVAMSENCEVLTADQRLANATASKLPVRWIGNYNPGQH